MQDHFIRIIQFLSADSIMEKQLYLTASVTLLLLTASATRAATQEPSFDSRFSKMDPGDGVTGQVEENHPFITLDECIVR